MNHKASSMETWNAIAYGKSSRPVWFPGMRLWRLGFRCGGLEKSSGFSRRVAPHLCAPRRASGRFPLFLPRRPALRHFAVRRPSPAWAAAGNQATQRTPEHCISRAEAASRNRGLFLRNSLTSRRHTPGQAARWSRGAGQPLYSACTRHRAPSSAKEPPFDTDLNQNKNFIFYFVSFLRM